MDATTPPLAEGVAPPPTGHTHPPLTLAPVANLAVANNNAPDEASQRKKSASTRARASKKRIQRAPLLSKMNPATAEIQQHLQNASARIRRRVNIEPTAQLHPTMIPHRSHPLSPETELTPLLRLTTLPHLLSRPHLPRAMA